jgi:hypothetical protein
MWRQVKPLQLLFRNSTIYVTKNKLYYVIYTANQHLYLTNFLRKVIGKKKDKKCFLCKYVQSDFISKNKHIKVHSDLEYNIQMKVSGEIYYNIAKLLTF